MRKGLKDAQKKRATAGKPGKLGRLIRSQRSEVRGQKPEVRGQKSEVRGQKSEARSQRPEARSQRPANLTDF
jgi:hypothetical protein